jgi:acetyltransferase
VTDLSAVFEPRRVAVVGASDQPGKLGFLVWANLSEFAGEVIPVTSSADEVGGRPAFRGLGEIEGEIDLAVLAVPAPAVPGIVREAAAKGVRAAVVLSGGFAETGAEGEMLQAELAQAAREGGMRVVGPNCFGVQNANLSLNASIASGPSTDAGGISLITQSGAYGMALHAMGTDEHIHFGKVYASGNKVDIGDHEVIEYLRDDPETDVICVFTESVGDGRALSDAIRSATPTKPVVIAKTGRSEAGSRAARSHTGSLASDDAVFRGAMRSAGAVVVRSGLEMLDVARLLGGQEIPGGPRAAIITNSGGTGVELVDLLADEGIEVPELSPSIQAKIAARLPSFASPRNPVDMTPVWSRFAELYPWLIGLLARSGEVDLVIPILLQRSAMDRSTVEAVADEVRRLREDHISVPVYVCWVAPRAFRVNADILQEIDVPCIEWPDRTARAVGHAVRYGAQRGRIRPRLEVPVAQGRLQPGPLSPSEGERLLSRFRVPVVPSRVCGTADEAVRAAKDLGFPVVMKMADASIAHRTEEGGVRTDVVGEAAVRAAFSDLSHRSNQVLVQQQAEGVEVAVGGVRDPEFGPLVMVGMGGILVEVLEDVVFAPAPIDAAEAEAMMSELRGYRLLVGFRGSEPVNVTALASIVSGVSRLMAAHPTISEIDLNPVIADSGGAVAVDWKIEVSREQ